MPKFFVVSDVHGFYKEMIRALNEVGYDADNPESPAEITSTVVHRIWKYRNFS